MKVVSVILTALMLIGCGTTPVLPVTPTPPVPLSFFAKPEHLVYKSDPNLSCERRYIALAEYSLNLNSQNAELWSRLTVIGSYYNLDTRTSNGK